MPREGPENSPPEIPTSVPSRRTGEGGLSDELIEVAKAVFYRHGACVWASVESELQAAKMVSSMRAMADFIRSNICDEELAFMYVLRRGFVQQTLCNGKSTTAT